MNIESNNGDVDVDKIAKRDDLNNL